jgi:hypothetical protein
VRYREYARQQAGFQRSSILFAAGTLSQKRGFRNTSNYFKNNFRSRINLKRMLPSVSLNPRQLKISAAEKAEPDLTPQRN